MARWTKSHMMRFAVDQFSSGVTWNEQKFSRSGFDWPHTMQRFIPPSPVQQEMRRDGSGEEKAHADAQAWSDRIESRGALPRRQHVRVDDGSGGVGGRAGCVPRRGREL